MNFVRSDEVARIRAQLDHPVIDGDGHLIEFTPLVRNFLAEIAGEEIAARFDTLQNGSALTRQVPREAKRGLGMTRYAWWGVPTRNTLDRAMAEFFGPAADFFLKRIRRKSREQRTFRVNAVLRNGRVTLYDFAGEHRESEFEAMNFKRENP